MLPLTEEAPPVIEEAATITEEEVPISVEAALAEASKLKIVQRA